MFTSFWVERQALGLDPRQVHIVYPVPARHGMPVGELATFFNGEFGLGVDLTR